MDDRLARLLLEDNIVARQKRDAARISLLEKLAVQASVIQLTIDQETPAALDNSLHWQNIFLFDEFAGFSATTFSDNTQPLVIGELGWTLNADAIIALTGLSGISDNQHYGLAQIMNSYGDDGYMFLNNMFSPKCKLLQFIMLSSAFLDAGDGCVFGLIDLGLEGPFAIDGSSWGIYFKREYTDTNWHTITTDTGGTTDTDTGVPFVASKWFLFEIKQETIGIIQFYINQVLVATHTTNVDAVTALYPTFGVRDPGSTDAISIVLDYFAMQLAPIVQRWD